ncbi:MAG TPA: adenylate/guanylate cyclase domain-containing protein [Rhizomicrobium sp.]
MSPKKVARRLAAILAADAVGYSRLVGQDEKSALEQFSAHLNELFVPKVKTHDGRVIKTMGDGVLVEFPSVVEALKCAIDIQRSMAKRNATVLADQRMEFRIGINSGDVVMEKGDIFGEGVNIAARLESIAEPGGISISQRVHEDVQNRVDVAFEDTGEQKLKNLSRPVRVYRVVLDRPAPRPSAALVLPDRPSLAVLPLQNMSGDPEQEYFADAMAEDLVTALSRWRSFFVIARNSSFTYKGRAVDVRRIGQELGVRYVLEGSVRKVENRVRLTAQLLEAANGTHIWAEKFDRDLVDILALQDELTQQVVSAIEPAVLNSENVRIARKGLNDYTAFDYYQRGMWHLNKVSADGYREAVALFRKAIDRDPQLPHGYVGLSRILYGGATFYGWSEHPDEDLQESLQSAAKAIALDRGDALAHYAYAGAALYLGQHNDALEAARRAVILNPNFALGILRFGQVQIYSGHPAEAIEPIERSIRHSPFDPQLGSMLGSLSLALYQAKNYERAVEQAQAAIAHNFQPGYVMLASALARLGRIDEARKTLPPELLARTMRDTPRLATYANPADRDHIFGGLALAGIGFGGPAAAS